MKEFKFLEVKNFDVNYKVSENHLLGEFVCSNYAYRNKVLVQYLHREDIVLNLEILCKQLITPLEKMCDWKFYVKSGFRTNYVDLYFNDDSSVMHKQGLAVDVYTGKFESKIVQAIRELDFHECFFHVGYVHLSYKPQFNEHRMLDFRNGSEYRACVP